jgi:hypothetical protein
MCKQGSWGGGYYICGKYHQSRGCSLNSYRRVHLERDVMEYLFSVLRSEDVFDKVQAKQQEDDVAELRLELARLEALTGSFPERKRRLFELYERADVTREEFIERKAEHAEQESRHSLALREKGAKLARMTSQKLDRETFEMVLGNLERDWERCDPAQRKQEVFSLVERIVVKDRTFKIYFRSTCLDDSSKQVLRELPHKEAGANTSVPAAVIVD